MRVAEGRVKIRSTGANVPGKIGREADAETRGRLSVPEPGKKYQTGSVRRAKGDGCLGWVRFRGHAQSSATSKWKKTSTPPGPPAQVETSGREHSFKKSQLSKSEPWKRWNNWEGPRREWPNKAVLCSMRPENVENVQMAEKGDLRGAKRQTRLC